MLKFSMNTTGSRNSALALLAVATFGATVLIASDASARGFGGGGHIGGGHMGGGGFAHPMGNGHSLPRLGGGGGGSVPRLGGGGGVGRHTGGGGTVPRGPHQQPSPGQHQLPPIAHHMPGGGGGGGGGGGSFSPSFSFPDGDSRVRSEVRRVGKEC